MPTLSVYEYQNPRQFLLDHLAKRQRRDTGYSVRAFARDMGHSSHTLLSLLLQGKRPLRVKHAAFLAKGIGLTSQERLYLQALIQFDSAEDPEEKKLCSLWLADLHPQREFRCKEIDEFTLISHWVHMAILAMTSIKGFDGTAEDVHRRLSGRVSIHEARAALLRLLNLGLLTREPSGRLRATYQRVTSREDIADRGARQYHKTVSELAIHALENIPVERREFQAFNLAVPESKIPLAKEMIRKFRAQFAKAIASDEADHVYQMNIQFFPLTGEDEADGRRKNSIAKGKSGHA